MTQYDNEFFRGPPGETPTLATDQRPTGVEIFQAKPERSTAVADVPVTKEEVPKDPPKKKSNARRISKAIKLLASCMAAVVITEAAANIAATIEPPADVPTGQYYAGQWPGAEPAHEGVYCMDLEADMGYSIQIPMDGNVWRLTADTDWRMCWWEGNGYGAYIDLYNRQTGVYLVADLSVTPHTSNHEEDSYTTLTTPTGDTLYVRSFFLSMGQYGEEYGLSEEMLAASAELRQSLVDEIFAGIQVTYGTADGWQGLEIGDKIYSQQSENWYGLGGFGDLDIHIPWVNYAEDYNLHNMTPYCRVNVNGITWSLYFAENDTYLWAVPNIDPEICLGGLTARFMCADAQRRGEYINDEEWLEMGGFTSASQRQTAVDIMIECLQHHYALADAVQESAWPEWPRIAEVDFDASLSFTTASQRGTAVQFSFGDRAYRITSEDPSLRFYWETTYDGMTSRRVHIGVASLDEGSQNWGLGLTIQRAPFPAEDDMEECCYAEMSTTDGEMMYLRFNSYWSEDVLEYSTEALKAIADALMASIQIQPDPDDSGWGRLLICDTMYSPQSMYWSGRGMVTESFGFDYIHTMEYEGLVGETPCEVRTVNGITWSFYYDAEDSIIWAQPDTEPEVCIGGWIDSMHSYYRRYHPDDVTGGWNAQYDVPYDDVKHAVEGLCEALSYIYPLGTEPEEKPMPGIEPGVDPGTEPGAELEDEAVWPSLLAVDSDASYGISYWSNQNTDGIFALSDSVYVIDSDREDLRFWWETGRTDLATVTVYSIPDQGGEQWFVTMWVQEVPFDTYDGDPFCYRTVRLAGNQNLYLRFDGDEALVDEIRNSIFFDYCGKEEYWHTVCIGNTLQTQQSYDWTGLGMVHQEYYFEYLHNAESVDLQDQDYEGQRTINGILWTFRFHKDNGVMYAYPESEPELCIGANPEVLWNWYDARYGALDDYFETLVESMSVGLQQYYLRPGVEIDREPVTGPVVVEPEQTNYVQFSLGQRGYYLESDLDGAWLNWYFTEPDDGEMVADLTVGVDRNGRTEYSAKIYIAENPLDAYDHLPHGWITVETGDPLYWYCVELYNGSDAQIADFMGSLTASGARLGAWGRVSIEDRIVSLQSLSWSGWESVEADGGRTVMMWNLERPAELDLGTPIAQMKINKVVWNLYITEEYSGMEWPFIWAVPDVDPNIAIGSDYENAVYKYLEDRGLTEDFDGDVWSDESISGAAEVIFEVLQNYYPT